MKMILFAEGSGICMFSLSRELFPNQFMKLFDRVSLFQKVFLRTRLLSPKSEISILGNTIHTVIASLRDGYDSIVGDQGLKLSGGEKQRIAIARALVREPEILVLDEATSNLDNESEAIVQESINQISQMVTTFIVAHRLSTIRRADTIYVMSRGRVVESGGHEELMEKRGRYWELYERSG